MTARRVAVIDLGTITTRLLLRGPAVEQRSAPVTRMGADLDRSGVIGPEGLERVRSALVEHRRALDGFGADALRVVATSAARDASNRDELFAVVSEVLGVEAELLSGEEEGRLTFAGATSSIPAASLPEGTGVGFVVLDIGGGSTEMTIGGLDGRPTGVFSADIGASRVTEAYLHHDPPWAQELSSALSVVQLHLDDCRREIPALAATIEGGTVVGVGGTITTLAAVEIGLAVHDSSRIHGAVLDREAVEEVFRTLATESRADRAHNPGLPSERVDLIVGGCVILVEAMRHLGIDRLVVSEADLLDGCAVGL